MLIKTNKFELEVTNTSLYIRAFNHEVYVNRDTYSAWNYIRESDNEREVFLGKLRVTISRTVPTQAINALTA